MEKQVGATGAYPYIGDTPMSTRDRLDHFKELKDNWVPNGTAPNHAGLDWLADEFESNYPDDLPTPLTFPTGGGGVSLEWWSDDDERASLEVDLEKRAATWYVFRPDSEDDDTYHEDVPVDGPRFWEWLTEQVRELPHIFEK